MSSLRRLGIGVRLVLIVGTSAIVAAAAFLYTRSGRSGVIRPTEVSVRRDEIGSAALDCLLPVKGQWRMVVVYSKHDVQLRIKDQPKVGQLEMICRERKNAGEKGLVREYHFELPKHAILETATVIHCSAGSEP